MRRRRHSSAAPAFDEGTFDTRPGTDRPIFEPIEEPRSTRRAANDDRETIGQILQAIQKGRPARNVYTLATLFAGVWIVGCGLLTISFLPSLQAAIGQGRRHAGAGRPCRACSSRRCCCSISSPALPGAARKCA